MPYIAEDEALNRSFVDLALLSQDAGKSVRRVCLVGTPGLRVVLLCWPPGFVHPQHVHPRAEEMFTIVRGRAMFLIGDEPEREAGPGELMLARRGVRHAVRVCEGEPLVLLAAVAPNEDWPDETIEIG